MSGSTKAFLVAGAFTVFLLITIAAQVSSTPPERGEEWLSWTPKERSTFIDGFITGYMNGSHKACAMTDRLFEVGKSHRLGDFPSSRCEARLENYSSRDFNAYSTTITEFYNVRPEYRGVPYFYLMRFLSDSQHKTAEQLYQMALKGELRTNF